MTFQTCSICSDVERRARVDAMLAEGLGLVHIAQTLGFSKSAVGRHKLGCAEKSARPFRAGDKWTVRRENEPCPVVYLRKGAIHFDVVMIYEPAIELPEPPPEEIPAQNSTAET